MSHHRHHGAHGRPADAAVARDLLKSLSGAVKLISLYHASHPVPAKAVEQAWTSVQRFHAEGGAELAIGLVDGRWIVDGAAVSEAAAPTETLAAMFRSLHLRTVIFQKGVRLFELTAFCKLAALAASPSEDIDPASYFKQGGVTHIRFDVSSYSRVAPAPKPVVPVVNPVLAPAAVKAPAAPVAAPAPRFSGQSFGTFIKGLVDNAVSDPQERAKIYSETLSQVKNALDRRVAEATKAARKENQVTLHELTRTEEVLTSVAEGKVIVDKDGRVLMMDAVAEELSGKRLVDLAGKLLQESVAGEGAVVSLSADMEMEGDKEPSHEVLTSGAEDVRAAIRHSTAVVQDEQGRVVGTYSVLPSTTKYKETLRLQEEFVSHITHELNAPLASICSALELVSEMAASKFTPQESHFIDVSLRNSRQLKQMISEILDFSKLQSGKMSVKPAAVPAAGILREAADALRPWAVSKGLTIDVENPESLEGLDVLADHGRIVQVLTNLISNAIKSTPSGGRITLSAWADPMTRRAILAVKDTGCGVAKDMQAKIFQRFTQVATGKRREGVGLGLAIVKELVGLHNGTLWLESEPGQGARFCFSLTLL